MSYRTMKAKYYSTCHGCSNGIKPGDLITFGGQRGRNYHVDCTGKTEVVATYFPSTGTTIYRNARGTCEDAPACGCCTF